MSNDNHNDYNDSNGVVRTDNENDDDDNNDNESFARSKYQTY